MNKVKLSKVNMFTVVALLFVKYADLFKDYVQLVTEITGFTTVNDSIGTDIGEQKRDTKGITASKNELVNAAAQITVDNARKARVWAENNNETELEHLFDIKMAKFHGIADKVILEMLKDILKALEDNLTHFTNYKIAQEDLTNITTAIDLAKKDLGKTKQAKKEKQISGKNIDDKLDKGEAYLFKIDDLLIPEYRITHPTVVEEYKLSRIEEPIGVHHTGIHPVIKNQEGDLLNGVLVSIPQLKKSTLSNYDGVGEITKFRTGKYALEFSLDGYATNKMLLMVPRGRVVDFEVIMIAKTLKLVVTKNGTPVAEYDASVVGTTISGATNTKGIVELRKAPNTGVVEVSSPGGDLVSLTYDFGGKETLKLNATF